MSGVGAPSPAGPPPRPWVKVCGITRVEDALRAVELGAGFIGLNFYPPSPRCLDLPRARRITEAVGSRARVVGVFVNRPAPQVEEIAAAAGLDLIQLHGDEGPQQAAAFGPRALKVFRTTGEEGAWPLERYAGAWGFLFDIRHASLYGGTGRTWRYGALAGLAAAGRPYFVAGGVGPGNARRALAESGAWGVDVCSGVESAPGIKDGKLLERLFEEVHHGQA